MNIDTITAGLREQNRARAERQWQVRLTSRLEAIHNEIATQHLHIAGLQAEQAALNAELKAGHKWDGRIG